MARSRHCLPPTGQNWRKVGAIENGDLLLRLSRIAKAYKETVGEEAVIKDPTSHFLKFRKQGGGPYFGIPEPMEEVSTAITEWAMEHVDAFSNERLPCAGLIVSV